MQIVIEVYRDCDDHPSIVDVWMDVDGWRHVIEPRPPVCEGIRQYVLAGGANAPTQEQRETLAYLEWSIAAEVVYFFRLPVWQPFKSPSR